MKKALSILLLSVMMILAGVFSPAGISIQAETLTEPSISSIGKDGSIGYFYLNQSNVTHAVIEYRFQTNGVVFSKLETLATTLTTQNNVMQSYRFQVTLPAGVESYRIWRVVKETKQYSVSGTHTFESPNAPMDGIEVRLKTIYVSNDLIEKRTVGAVNTATLIVEFMMYFNVVDELGVMIPIDRIHRIRVEYDVISTTWGIVVKNHYTKDIMARQTRSMTIFPYVIPSEVINNIQTSSKSGYRWQLNLGSFNQSIGLWSDTTLDKTTMLQMDYYYDGYFFQDQVVIDEPYNWEDIVIVNPILDPNNLLMSIASWVIENPGTAITIVMGILVLSLLAKLLGALGGIFSFLGIIFRGIGKVIVFVFQLIWKTLKLAFSILGKIGLFVVKLFGFKLKLLFILVPMGIVQFLYFLVTPCNKRRERKEIHYVSRSL